MQHLIERLQQSKTITDIVIATTTERQEQPIIDIATKMHCGVFRGDENDVLGRVNKAASMAKYSNTIVVDITADCPLVDPFIIDLMVNTLNKYGADYVSNTITRSWPDGFDVQVYRMEVLDKINSFVLNENHRTHTGWNIINYSYVFYPKGIKMINLPAPPKYFMPDMGLTLDTSEDLQVLDSIFSHFQNNLFSAEEAIDFVIMNPKILANKNIKRNTPGV